MRTSKLAGIYMDHATATILEFVPESNESKSVASEFTHEVKEETIRKSESLMHHKEQHEEAAYYKIIGEAIKNYDEALLFGPTEAKNEMYNTIKNDQQFKKIKLHLKQTDKLTENQQHAFVKDFFVKNRF